MIVVHVRNNDIQSALREFKKRVKKAGILSEVEDRRYFVPKSEKRRMKRIAARFKR